MLYSTDKEEEKRIQEYYDNPNAERNGRGITWATHMAMMHHKFNVDKSIEEMDKETLKKFLHFRISCIQEEVDELKGAAKTLLPQLDCDPEEVVDALIDICVFAIGTLDLFGVDADLAWREVYEANSKKEVGIKEERPNPFGLPDLIKPDDWEPPCHEGNHGKFEGI
jgi:predicted HAD superfamily Cof-like phosphohydrolase